MAKLRTESRPVLQRQLHVLGTIIEAYDSWTGHRIDCELCQGGESCEYADDLWRDLVHCIGRGRSLTIALTRSPLNPKGSKRG